MKDNKGIDIWKIVLEAILMALFATSVSLGFGWLNKSDLYVNVTSPAFLNGTYTTMIDFKNFSKTESQKDVEIVLSSDNEITYWESNVQSSRTELNTITINKIVPDSNCCLLLKTKEPLDSNNTRIISKAKTSLVFLDKQKSFSKSLIIMLIMNLVAMAITYMIIFGLLEKKRLERRAEIEEQDNRLKEQLNQRIAQAEKDVAEGIRLRKETQLFYAARFSDYSRELTFWKDTVRKLVYSFGKSEKDAETLFDVVTDNLKTYTTKKIDKQDYETITYIAERIARTMSQENKGDK